MRLKSESSSLLVILAILTVQTVTHPLPLEYTHAHQLLPSQHDILPRNDIDLQHLEARRNEPNGVPKDSEENPHAVQDPPLESPPRHLRGVPAGWEPPEPGNLHEVPSLVEGGTRRPPQAPSRGQQTAAMRSYAQSGRQ